MSKQSPIRYLAVTTHGGDKFTIRVTRETAKGVSGIEVDRDGEEIVPVGFHNRTRIVPRDAIKRAVEMRMNVVYGRIERAK
jgi:hypothetical protein